MTSDLFSEKQCPACGGAYRIGIAITDALWAKILRKDDPRHSEDVCANCVVERLGDLDERKYPNLRMMLLSDDEIVDAVAHGRRQGWMSLVHQLELVGGAFLPMTTVLEMMEQEPDGTYKFMNGLNLPLKQVFKSYADEFYRRIEELKNSPPPGGLEDRLIAETPERPKGRGALVAGPATNGALGNNPERCGSESTLAASKGATCRHNDSTAPDESNRHSYICDGVCQYAIDVAEQRQMSRGQAALKWAVATFGEIATDKPERAMRFIEEALELVYAIGLSADTVEKIANRVYSRPKGDRWQEFGQVQLTIELLAEVYETDPQMRSKIEFERVQAIPKDEWERRHKAKVALGIAK